MEDKSAHHDVLEYLLHSRFENAHVFTAIAVGLFGVLLLLSDGPSLIQKIALSAVYWTIYLIGGLLYLTQQFHHLLVERAIRKAHPEIDSEMKDLTDHSRLLKWLYPNLWSHPDQKRQERLIMAFSVLMTILAFSLWYTITFDIGIS